MASIREKGPYQFHAQIRRKGWPQQSRTFRTKKEAQAWAREIEHEMDQGVFIDLSTLETTSFADRIELYIAEQTAN